MSNKILVTDSLFIFDEHIKKLNDAGFEVERLDKPNASNAELIAALKGKVGYILGGIERPDDEVIESADELKAIALTLTVWEWFLVGKKAAIKKGIKVACTPHANAESVAEWAFSVATAMVRNLFELGRTGDKTFQTALGFEEQTVGIIGLGHVGSKLAELFSTTGFKVSYWSHSPKKTSYQKQELETLLKQSDIVCFCVSANAGKNFVSAEKLSLMRDGTIIACLAEEVINQEALLAELKTGRLRAYCDFTPKNKEFSKLPFDVFYCSNESAAYNSHSANKRCSDWSTDSMINLLTIGKDKYQVL